MGTTAQKLQAVVSSKAAIASAITTKGGTVPTRLSQYGQAILDLNTGAGDLDGSITEVEIAPAVNRLREYVFAGCVHLEEVSVPLTVATIDTNAFSRSSIEDLTMEGRRKSVVRAMSGFPFGVPANAVIHCTDGDMDAQGTDIPVPVPSGEMYMDGTTAIMPSGLTVADDRFKGGQRVFDIDNQSEDLLEIEDEAFKGCKLIETYDEETFVASDPDLVKYTVGDSAFEGCSALATFATSKAREIGTRAFKGASSLLSLAFPVLTKIADEAFSGCSALATFAAQAVTSIGKRVFEGCTSLTSVSFPAIDEVKEECFKGCTALTTATMGNVKAVGKGAFEGCSALTTVTLNGSVTSIGDRAFAGTGSHDNWSVAATTFGHAVFTGDVSLVLLDGIVSQASAEVEEDLEDYHPTGMKGGTVLGDMADANHVNSPSQLDGGYIAHQIVRNSVVAGGSASRSETFNPTSKTWIKGYKWGVFRAEYWWSITSPIGRSSIGVMWKSPKIGLLEMPNATEIKDEGLMLVHVDRISTPVLTTYRTSSMEKDIFWWEHNNFIDSFESDVLKGVRVYKNTVYKYSQISNIDRFPWGLGGNTVLILKDGCYHPVGKCSGGNYTLTYDGQDVVMTFQGTGDVGSDGCISALCDVVKKVIIPDGVQNILPYSFRDVVSLNSLVMPTGINVGNYAFKGCNLSNIAEMTAASFGITAFSNGSTLKKIVGNIDRSFTGAEVRIGQYLDLNCKAEAFDHGYVEEVVATNSILEQEEIQPEWTGYLSGKVSFLGRGGLTEREVAGPRGQITMVWYGLSGSRIGRLTLTNCTSAGEKALMLEHIGTLTFKKRDVWLASDSMEKAVIGKIVFEQNTTSEIRNKPGFPWGLDTSKGTMIVCSNGSFEI